MSFSAILRNISIAETIAIIIFQEISRYENVGFIMKLLCVVLMRICEAEQQRNAAVHSSCVQYLTNFSHYSQGLVQSAQHSSAMFVL